MGFLNFDIFKFNVQNIYHLFNYWKKYLFWVHISLSVFRRTGIGKYLAAGVGGKPATSLPSTPTYIAAINVV